MALNTNTSIVDYLKSQGQDSSYASRKKLAEQYGIGGYSGTAAQNTALLNALRGSGGGQSTANNAPSPNVTTGTGVAPQAPGPSYEQNKPTYVQGHNVAQAYDDLTGVEGQRPGEYESQYRGQIDDILDNILNNKKFSYDMNADPLYQQYKDQYMRQGNLAMRDTMGNAAALTGGYGSTYASTAGSQAYDQHLAGLNDKVPQLYQLAYNMYRDDQAERYNQLGALQGLDNTDYGRYRDTVGDWESDRSYYYNKANQMYNQDYAAYQDALSAWQADRQYGYGKDRDAVSDSQWQQEFDYQKSYNAQQLALQTAKAQAAEKAKTEKTNKSSYTVRGTLDKYVDYAKEMLEASDEYGEKIYDSAAVIKYMMDTEALSKADAQRVINLAGGDLDVANRELRYEPWYQGEKNIPSMVSQYAKRNKPIDTVEYIGYLYDSGVITEEEAEDYIYQLGLDDVLG